MSGKMDPGGDVGSGGIIDAQPPPVTGTDPIPPVNEGVVIKCDQPVIVVVLRRKTDKSTQLQITVNKSSVVTVNGIVRP